jgi:hypothetical protein
LEQRDHGNVVSSNWDLEIRNRTLTGAYKGAHLPPATKSPKHGGILEMTKPDVHAKQIVELGYTVFPSLLTAACISPLRGAAQAKRASGGMYISTDLFETHPAVILPLVTSALVLDTLELIVGPFVQLDSVSLMGIAVDCPADISWHRDPYGSVPRGQDFQKPMSLNLLIYLQDLTDSVGPLRVIPGSHRYPLMMTAKEQQRPHSTEEMIHARAGDGVLIHNNLVHSRSRNNSKQDRMYLTIVYNLTCIRPSMDLSAPALKAITNDVRKNGSPRLMRLFGEDRFGAKRYNCGFMSNETDLWDRWINEERRLSAAPEPRAATPRPRRRTA